MTIHDFLRARIFARCGIDPDGKEYKPKRKLEKKTKPATKKMKYSLED